jgi:hypothetical protein
MYCRNTGERDSVRTRPRTEPIQRPCVVAARRHCRPAEHSGKNVCAAAVSRFPPANNKQEGDAMAPKPPKDRRGLRLVRDGDDPEPEIRMADLSASIPQQLRVETKICAAEEGETMAQFVARALKERIASLRAKRGK